MSNFIEAESPLESRGRVTRSPTLLHTCYAKRFMNEPLVLVNTHVAASKAGERGFTRSKHLSKSYCSTDRGSLSSGPLPCQLMGNLSLPIVAGTAPKPSYAPSTFNYNRDKSRAFLEIIEMLRGTIARIKFSDIHWRDESEYVFK